MSRILFISCFISTFLLPIGCKSSQHSPSDPDALYLNLWARKSTGQYVHYIINPNGQYHYAGGQQAMFRDPAPVTELTTEQLNTIKQLINQHKLQELTQTSSTENSKIVHELELHLNARRSRVKLTGTPPPGLIALEQNLFKIQSQERFNDVYQPIERKLKGK